MIGINGKNSPIHDSMQIIFFDSSSSVTDLLKVITNQESKIFTFDYKSHKILVDNKIDHEISDTQIEKDDYPRLQQISYRLAKWAQEPNISPKLNYDNINLGNLFYIEFHYMFLPFLKKLIEIERIVKKNQNSKFVVSNSFYEMVNFFTKNVFKLDTVIQQEQFLYDVIKVPIKIYNITFTLIIKKSTYNRLKNFSEKIISNIFGLTNKSKHTKKSCLLVELDIIRYEELLTNKSPDYPNFILFNRRRPYVWNNKSLSILKNSNCSIVTHDELVDKRIKNIVKDDKIINERISSLLEEEDFFNAFFTVDKINFWLLLKPRFIELFKKRISEAIYEIELTKNLFKKFCFSTVLLWSECGFNEQIVLNLAKQCGTKIVLIQHGLYYDTQEAKEYNQFVGIFPDMSDRFLVWGNVMKQYAEKNNYGQKTTVIGSQFYDKSIQNHDVSDGDYILLTTTSPGQNQITDLTVSSMHKYENTIKKISEIVSKLNKKLIIKLHPFQDELNITHLVKTINPNIAVTKGGSSLSLIRSCELLLSIDISTTILEAQILNKPVISISVKDYGFGTPTIFKSNSCIRVQVEELENVLKKTLTDKEFKKHLIENGKKYVDDYISNRGHASKEILSYLSKYSNDQLKV